MRSPPRRQHLAVPLRHHQDRLQESEERFRQLSDAAAEGVVVHDRGVVLAANQSLARMFGYEMDEIIGRNFLDILPSAESREDIIRHMRTDSYERYEAFAGRKDGSEIIVELTGRSMNVWRKARARSACNDITKRKQGEEALRSLIEEQARRAAAELARASRPVLAEASRVLDASFDDQTTPSTLARLAVPQFADYCTVDMIGDGGTRSNRHRTCRSVQRRTTTKVCAIPGNLDRAREARRADDDRRAPGRRPKPRNAML